MSAPEIIYPPAVGGGTPVGGSGTPGTIPVWNTGTTLTDSIVKQSTVAGTNLLVGGNVSPYATAGRTSLVVDGSTSSLLAFTLAGSAGGYINVTPANASFVSVTRPIEIAAGGANQISFTTNSLERMRITDTGNVGIGTASPAQTLDIRNTAPYQLRVGSSPGFSYDIGRSTTDGLLYFYGNQTGANGVVFGGINGERARIDSSGNLVVGLAANASSTDNRLQLANSSAAKQGMEFRPGVALSGGGTGSLILTYDRNASAYQGTDWNTLFVKLPQNNSYFDASASGGGLKLHATPGNPDTQTLDCYQENTGWVPTITFGGASTGMTYTTQAGSWTKIGNLVFVTGRIVLSAKGSSTGVARLANLPVAVGASNASGGGMVGPVANITFGGQLAIYAVASATTLGLAKNTSGGAAVDLTDADFTNTSDITFSCIYRV